MADSSATMGDLINNAAATHGVPVSWMTSILNVENPNLNPNALSQTNVQGLSQIEGATWITANGPNVPYSLDPAAQLNTQAKLLAKYQTDYNGNFALAAAAYNGGPGVANAAQNLMNQGVPQSQAISQAAGQVYGNGSAKQTEINNYVPKATGQSAASTSSANAATQVPYLTDDSDPATAIPVSGMTIPSSQLQSILTAVSPPLVNSTGVNRVPWYADNGIIKPKTTDAVGFPVTFQIYFNVNQNPLPIVIALKASLRSHQKAMRHLTTRSRTRTGFRLNLWGMVPDQITGQASTGLMMNQLGVTDFLSLTTATAEVRSLVAQAFKSPHDRKQLASINSKLSNEGFLRIAAKDSFIEFLSLFENNGTVWFQNQNYTGYTTGKEQMAADVWSPATGSTTFQNAARRNDVMTRGKVVMNFRNTAYYGYFKSLSWVMDAEHPFRWNFNFVYQVESTITNVGLPNS